MEDIVLYMQNKNKCLPYLILEDGQYIFVGPYVDPIRHDDFFEIEDNSFQIILPIESILDDTFFVNSQGVIEYCKPSCYHCGSRNVVKKDFNWKNLNLDNGVLIRVKVKRYLCKKCNKKFQTSFSKVYEKYCNFSVKFKEIIRSCREKDYISLRGMKRVFKEVLNVNISHETIRKALIYDDDFYFLNESLKLSGYYGYDEQYVKISGIWHYYLVIFDLINNVPVAASLVEKLTKEVIYDFINLSVPLNDRVAIVTDSNWDYGDIIPKLGFVHQCCTFHLEKNIKTNMKKKINEDMNKYRFKLELEHPNWSDNKIKEIVDCEKDELKSEMWDYITEFMEIFKHDSLNEAIEYINYLKTQMEYYPKHLSDYLNRNFFPEYRKYLHYLENRFEGKLDPTNNKLENYNGITMPRYEKKSYRTKLGFWSAAMLKKDGWIKNRN